MATRAFDGSGTVGGVSPPVAPQVLPSTGHASEATPPIIAPDTDAATVIAAQRDRVAFAALYRAYVTPVFRYTLARLGHREAAEDATSQTFARALAAIGQCDPEKFRPWLFTIAHNIVTDARRRAKPVTTLDAANEVPDRLPSPEDAALASESERAVLATLARLPDDQRRVMELRLAGLSGPEIAQVLGRSHGAVRMLQVRAVAKLRDLHTPIDANPQSVDETALHQRASKGGGHERA